MKTTVILPDELHRALEAAAQRDHRSMADLMREALQEKLERLDQPRPRSIGAGYDPELDARDAKAWVREQWSARWSH